MINLNDKKCVINNQLIVQELTRLNIEPRLEDGLFGFDTEEIEFAVRRITKDYYNKVRAEQEVKQEVLKNSTLLNKPILNKREVAEILNVSSSTVDRYRQSGCLKANKSGNDKSKVLFDISEVKRYLKELRKL